MSKINFLTVKANATLSAINENFNRIKQELQDKVLYRNNPVGEPNALMTDVDANGKRIVNLPKPIAASEAARMQDLIDLSVGIIDAQFIPFTPSGTIGSDNVQDAVEEVSGDVDTLSSTLSGSGGSNSVGFLQGGTGAVQRTVQGKIREIVSVKDFGALGNDVADDTVAINNAIAYVQGLGGGTVFFPAGTYKTTGTINITGNGVCLFGLVAGSGVESYPGAATQPAVTIKTTATVGIKVQGPITGFGIQNIGVMFNGAIASSIGIHVNGGNQGDCRNIYVFNAKNAGILDDTTPTWPGEHNSWTNIHVLMPFPADPTSVGIKVTGDAVGGDRYFDTWTNLIITPTHTGQTALHLGYCDSLTFTNVEIKPIGCKGIVFDYSINNGMPNNVCFYNLDVYDNSVTNIGSPLVTTAENRVFGFSTGNGALVPHIRGFRIMDVPFFSRTKMYLNSAQSIGNVGTIVTLNATEVDLDTIASTVNNRIIPYRPGVYKVTAQIMAAASITPSQVIANIGKNGFGTIVATAFALNSSSQASVLTTGYVTMNGTTDYVQLIGQVTGGSTAIQTGANNTWLCLEGPI